MLASNDYSKLKLNHSISFGAKKEKAKHESYITRNKKKIIIRALPSKRAKNKGANDAPTSNSGSCKGGVIEEIQQTQPRNPSPNKNSQKQAKCKII